jgi:hypothetical protein
MRVYEQMRSPLGVQDVVREWWDVDISLECAAVIYTAYIKTHDKRVKASLKTDYLVTAAGPLVWLKSKLLDLALLPGPGGCEDDEQGTVTAVLHIGFLCLEETEEMLANLRNETPQEDVNRPARSKMFTVAQRQTVAPIDALAGIVTRTRE